MARTNLSLSEQIEEALVHAIATAMGRTPKKALIIDGPMRSRKGMRFWLKRWKNRGPAPNFVMSKGTWFEGRANVEDYSSAVKWRREHRPRGGQCFHNARQFCLAHPNARYFEGFYLIFKMPEDHAWVVMEDGMVLDFTHEAVIRKLVKEKKKVDVRSPLYLGVQVPHNPLIQLHTSVARNTPILELYEQSLMRRH